MKTIWFVIKQGEAEFICTMPDRIETASIGAHAAHGPFVAYPFTVARIATPEEAAWAEAEVEFAIMTKEAEEAAME